MNASISTRVNRRRSQRRACVEALEGRTLLSAFGTVDTFWLATGTNIRTRALSFASDSAGHVYAVGMAWDGTTNRGIIREATNGTWSTIENLPNMTFWSAAVDSAGDLFVVGDAGYFSAPSVNPSGNSWTIAVRPAGQSNFALVTDSPTANTVNGFEGIALDGSGNVFVSGSSNEKTVINKHTSVTYTHWIVRKESLSALLAGHSSFTTVDDFLYNSSNTSSSGIANIASGPAAGLYVVGHGGSSTQNWLVRKSTNGGSTWTTVDNFAYSSSSSNLLFYDAVAGDASGNVYYVGQGQASSGQNRWVVRRSSNGGSSWSTSDDYALSSANANAYTIITDGAGNAYVSGTASDGTSNTLLANHAIVRTNVGGSWHTIDDYWTTPGTFGGNGGGGAGYGIGQDSLGNLYGGDGALGPWAIRSLPSAPANLTATADSINSSSQINLAWTNSAGGDESGFAIYRSTDGTNFNLVNTVGASTTTYADTGLSAGTIYYYYVTAVLNSVDGSPQGSSAPSNTASAATQSGGMAAPAAAAAVFSSTQISSSTDPTDIFHHRKHRK